VLEKSREPLLRTGDMLVRDLGGVETCQRWLSWVQPVGQRYPLLGDFQCLACPGHRGDAGTAQPPARQGILEPEVQLPALSWTAWGILSG